MIPVIRIDDAQEDRQTTAKILREACMNVGFFYLEGHGIPHDLLEKVFLQSQKLFHLSTSAKQALKDATMSRGYTAMEEETLDPKSQTKGDTKEGFYIGPEISKDDPRFNPAKLSGPNVWPTEQNIKGELSAQDCQDFRTVMDEYFSQMTAWSFRVTQLLALALELNPHYFDPYFQEPMGFIRLLHYAKETSNPENGVFACGAHSDYGMITLLLTDHQPGLQIHYKGDWVDAPPRPNAFVVNLGKYGSETSC